MKLSFWTLGMPAWTNAETAAAGAKFGFDGVDLRCTRPEDGKPSDLGNLCIETPDAELDEIKATYAAAGVEISCMLCYNRGGHHGGDNVDWEALEAELADHARVAGRIGASMMRVTVGRPPEGMSWDDYLDSLARTSISAVSGVPGLAAVYENHVGSASAEQLFRMAERAGDPRIGVVYSPDHCLVMQEDNVELCDRYADYVKQVSFADRKVVQEDLGRFDGRYYYVQYETCENGEGIVPAARIFETLRQRGFDGYVALKWEKSARFGHHLPSGDVAMPRFIEFMRTLGVKEPVQSGR